MGGILRKPIATFPRAHPVGAPHSLPMPSVSSVQRPKDTTAVVCFQCGQPGHLRPDCLKHFDIYYLSLEEGQAFAEDKFVALDVRIAHDGCNDVIEKYCKDKVEEAELGFGMGNK